jgi:hypothetical protein
MAIQPASTMAQPFSTWWPMTVVSTLSAMSPSPHTPTLRITRSKNTYTPARTSVTPSSACAINAVGVEPTLTTGHGRPASRSRCAACTQPARSCSAMARRASGVSSS